MGLFTNPVILNNGTARSYEYMGPTNTASELQGVYLESAATLSEMSQIIARYDRVVKKLRRGNLKIVKNYATSALIMAPITMNISFIADPLHSATDIESHLKLGGAACAATNFYANFVKRLL